MSDWKPDVDAATCRIACPFCDGKYSMTLNEKAKDDEEYAWLLHTMPPCKEYNEMDVLDFLVSARLERQAKSKKHADSVKRGTGKLMIN